MVEPTGVSKRIDERMPNIAQKTDITAEKRMTDLKFLKSRMDERAGKMIRAEIKREPTRFMASTITTAVTTAITML